jgi:hypothetical protein
MKLVAACLFAVLLFAVPAMAADVDGKWSGMIETPMGSLPVGFTFKADGTSLTGTTTSIDGSEVAISDGTIDGAKIAFVVKLDFAGMPLVLNYTGEVSTTEIKLSADVMGIPLQFTVQKAKE